METDCIDEVKRRHATPAHRVVGETELNTKGLRECKNVQQPNECHACQHSPWTIVQLLHTPAMLNRRREAMNGTVSWYLSLQRTSERGMGERFRNFAVDSPQQRNSLNMLA